jgi:hypothetical protein
MHPFSGSSKNIMGLSVPELEQFGEPFFAGFK